MKSAAVRLLTLSMIAPKEHTSMSSWPDLKPLRNGPSHYRTRSGRLMETLCSLEKRLGKPVRILSTTQISERKQRIFGKIRLYP